jgi:hypothetical protein
LAGRHIKREGKKEEKGGDKRKENERGGGK